MNQIVRPERQQPGEEYQQAGVRGELRRGEPAKARTDRQYERAARHSGAHSGRQADSRLHGIGEGLGQGTDEDAAGTGARLGLSQLEVVTLSAQLDQVTVREQSVQIREPDGPTRRLG